MSINIFTLCLGLPTICNAVSCVGLDSLERGRSIHVVYMYYAHTYDTTVLP